VGYLYLIELERGSGRANRKWCARMGRVEVQQVVEEEGVYKCMCGWDYFCVLDGCLLACFHCKPKFVNLIIQFAMLPSQPKILFHVDETGIKSLHMKYFM